MQKLYYLEPYQRSLNCTVVEVRKTENNLEVITDKTIFYPEGGGQKGDRGLLGQYEVFDTHKGENGESVLCLSLSSNVSVGDNLNLELDWNHRYKYMVEHTCQHLISATLFHEFSIGTVAVHLGEEYLSIETDQSAIDDCTIERLVEVLNSRVGSSHNVFYYEVDHEKAITMNLRRPVKVEGRVRIVEIEGLDKIACAGVHVKNTKEIRLVNYLYQEQIRSHTRLYFSCGEQAIKECIFNCKVVSMLTKTLNCKESEILDKTNSLLANLSETKVQVSEASKALAAMQVEKNLDDGLCVLNVKEDTDLQHFAQCVLNYSDIAMLILCPEKERTRFLIALKGRFEKISFNEVKKVVLDKVNARGGGRSPIFQGTFCNVDKTALKNLIEDFKGLASKLQIV